MGILEKINNYLLQDKQNILWPTWSLDNPLLEKVIIPDIDEYIKVFSNNDFENMVNKCDNYEDFIGLLNHVFKSNNIKFIFKPSRKNDAETKNRIIFIYVGDKILYNFLNKNKQFINTIRVILSHELIHKEQQEKIDWSNYYHKISSIKGNIDNKQEIMAYSNTVVKKLSIKLGGYKLRMLKWLQKPQSGVILEFDIYLNNFDKNHKVIKRLYKYMYEYIIT